MTAAEFTGSKQSFDILVAPEVALALAVEMLLLRNAELEEESEADVRLVVGWRGTICSGSLYGRRRSDDAFVMRGERGTSDTLTGLSELLLGSLATKRTCVTPGPCVVFFVEVAEVEKEEEDEEGLMKTLRVGCPLARRVGRRREEVEGAPLMSDVAGLRRMMEDRLERGMEAAACEGRILRTCDPPAILVAPGALKMRSGRPPLTGSVAVLFSLRSVAVRGFSGLISIGRGGLIRNWRMSCEFCNKQKKMKIASGACF